MQNEWTAIAALATSGATIAGAFFVAFAKRGDASVTRQANLDIVARDIMNRQRDDFNSERTLRELWERRARRADSWAHKMRHDLANALLALGRSDPVPEIPLLEDPF